MDSKAKSVSERRLAANRANAKKSTGPRTAEGKTRSSLNAVKTGLTGHTILLPSDDVEAYREHVERMNAALQPVGTLEEQLVQTLADLQWRLNRITSLESGYLALARRRLDPALFADEPDPDIRAVLIETHVQDAAAKSLENLHRQEQRLRRQYAGENKELNRLQENRKEAARQQELRNAWCSAYESVMSCPCENCQQSRNVLFGTLGLGKAVASNSKKAKPEWTSPPSVILVDDRPGSPTSA